MKFAPKNVRFTSSLENTYLYETPSIGSRKKCLHQIRMQKKKEK